MKRRLKLKAKKALPIGLAIVSSAGVILTGYEAAKATPKALELIEEAKTNKGEDLSKFETVKAAAPAYLKTAAVAGTTIACIAGNHILNAKQQASLIGAAKITSDAYSDYQNKVKELYGEDAHKKVMAAVAEDKAHPEKITTSNMFGYASLDFEDDDPNEERLFYEPISRKMFVSTKAKIVEAEYHINRLFCLDGYARLDEFYDFLGIKDLLDKETNRYSETVGWTIADGDNFWIEFDHSKWTIDGKECYMIDTVWQPCEDYISLYR